MKIKTEDLIDAALDWAVAKCEGEDETYVLATDQFVLLHDENGSGLYCYSTNWAQGGPIIEREEIDVVFRPGDKLPGFWDAYSKYAYSGFPSPTPLIAAMRCYVASKLGDEVEVPGELT